MDGPITYPTPEPAGAVLVRLRGLRARRGDVRGPLRRADRGELVRAGRQGREAAPPVELLERHGVRGGAPLQTVGQVPEIAIHVFNVESVARRAM